MLEHFRQILSLRFGRFLVAILILGVGVVGAVALMTRKGTPPRKQPDSVPTLVETQAVEPAPESFSISTHGTVVPKRELTLAAEVQGKVVRKSKEFDAGTFVTKGTFLLEIDPRVYELEVTRLESEVKQVQIDLFELELEESNNEELIAIAKSDLELNRRELDRTEKLLSQQAGSVSDRDKAARDTMRAQNSLQQLHNAQRLIAARREGLGVELELRNARLERAKLDLAKTTIDAPIDGLVTTELVEENDFVQPGTVLLKIEDTSAVEVRCNLRLLDLYWLWMSRNHEPKNPDALLTEIYHAPKADATVTYLVAGRSYVWDGFLSRYEGVGLDEKTRTFPCRIEVPSPTRDPKLGGPPTLVRGMFVEVQLQASPKIPLLQIPERALRPDDEVWCVRSGTLHVRKVRVAKRLEEEVLLFADSEDSDLKVGDRVVVSPLATVFDGMKVREE